MTRFTESGKVVVGPLTVDVVVERNGVEFAVVAADTLSSTPPPPSPPPTTPTPPPTPPMNCRGGAGANALE